MFTWLWNNVVAFVGGLLAWIFDPVKWLDLSVELLGALLQLVAYVLPADISNQVQSFGARMQAVDVTDGMGVVVWLASPACEGNVFLACIGAYTTAWVISLLLKVIFWVKSHIYMGGA
jgi:hypothetical protein